MTHDRRNQQHHNQRRQKPDRTNDEIHRKREVDPANREKSEERLAARFGFIDVVVLVRHHLVLTENLGDAQKGNRELPGCYRRNPPKTA